MGLRSKAKWPLIYEVLVDLPLDWLLSYEDLIVRPHYCISFKVKSYLHMRTFKSSIRFASLIKAKWLLIFEVFADLPIDRCSPTEPIVVKTPHPYIPLLTASRTD